MAAAGRMSPSPKTEVVKCYNILLHNLERSALMMEGNDPGVEGIGSSMEEINHRPALIIEVR